jgi:hypothetical protein
MDQDMFQRLSLVFFATLAIALLPRLAVPSSYPSIEVLNRSDHCAWVTFYHKGLMDINWTMQKNQWWPGFLGPNWHTGFASTNSWRMKVLVEIMPGIDHCGGNRIGAIDFVTDVPADRVYLRHTNGRWTLTR